MRPVKGKATRSISVRGFTSESFAHNQMDKEAQRPMAQKSIASVLFSRGPREKRLRLGYLLVFALTTHSILAQDKSPEPSKKIDANIISLLSIQPQTSTPSQQRLITIKDAVSIFLQQNLQLVAARYDIDSADAEKLTARLRPNPQLTLGLSGLPLNLSGPFISEQTYSYGISQTIEMGGKRSKRIASADANSEVARGQFQMVVWQLTNDLKRKFYTVVLDQSLLDLAKQNQTTFAEIVKHTTELLNAGEISGLNLERLEVEKLKFDSDVANAERDYEVAVRDLRFTLGGDYRAMEIDVAGSIDFEPYQFSFSDLRDKALAARPDLKAAQLSERAADANIRLQNAQRIPDLTVGPGINQVPTGGSTYTVGIGIALPVSDRNQGERAKALIGKQKAQNQERLITNQVLSDVDKAFWMRFGRDATRLPVFTRRFLITRCRCSISNSRRPRRCKIRKGSRYI